MDIENDNLILFSRKIMSVEEMSFNIIHSYYLFYPNI